MKLWEEDAEGYQCVDGRFRMLTWEFGGIHQVKIMVSYQDEEIGICLEPTRSRKTAMQKCEKWVQHYLSHGPDSPSKVIADAFEHWPTLYLDPSNDIPVIEHMFFTIGNGYDWLDGSLVQNSPEDWIVANKRIKELDKIDKSRNKLLKESRKLSGKMTSGSIIELRKELYRKDVYRFYPVSKGYSNICFVPNDVTKEWLELSYRAALLLRDKSGIPDIKSIFYRPTEHDESQQRVNREIGAQVVADLEKRFPHVKEIQQVSTEKA